MALINNNSVNYSIYYNVLNYFKTVLNNHPSINYVSQGDMYGIDTKSFPQYPVANIMVQRVRFAGSTSIYTCQLLVADKSKDAANKSDGVSNEMSAEFYGTDDTVHIHANTLAVINDILSFTEMGTTGFDIDADITVQPFADRMDNGLVGWIADFDLITHNDRNKCIFNLLSEGELTNC